MVGLVFAVRKVVQLLAIKEGPKQNTSSKSQNISLTDLRCSPPSRYNRCDLKVLVLLSTFLMFEVIANMNDPARNYGCHIDAWYWYVVFDGARLRRCTAHWRTLTTAVKEEPQLLKSVNNIKQNPAYSLYANYKNKNKNLIIHNTVHSASFARARVASTTSHPRTICALASVGGEFFLAHLGENSGLRYPQPQTSKLLVY